MADELTKDQAISKEEKAHSSYYYRLCNAGKMLIKFCSITARVQTQPHET